MLCLQGTYESVCVVLSSAAACFPHRVPLLPPLLLLPLLLPMLQLLGR
jgi:hypothetical protein